MNQNDKPIQKLKITKYYLYINCTVHYFEKMGGEYLRNYILDKNVTRFSFVLDIPSFFLNLYLAISSELGN